MPDCTALRGVIFCMAAFAAFFMAEHGFAQPLPAQQCTVPNISVIASDESTARSICDIAAKTDTRLRALGLQLSEPIQIEVTETLNAPEDACVALYNPRLKVIQVLPTECLADQHGRAITFPEMSVQTYFESLIVHEMVHAYVDQTPKGPYLTTLAQEYLAYAIQIEALPEDVRDNVLAKAAIKEPVNFRDIRQSTLERSPVQFSALCWMHFKEAGGDALAVTRVVEDRVLLFRLAK